MRGCHDARGRPLARAVIYLSTPPTTANHCAMVADGSLGVMLTPRVGRSISSAKAWPIWAADNGCFSAADKFNLSRYLSWLDRMRAVSGCLFATAPDVVGDAVATWERSHAVLPQLRALGYRAALVIQNGISRVEWGDIDAVFIGGSTDFKFSDSANDVAREAKSRGLWAHMGRVNSWRRWERCAAEGYDSCDGTFLAFGPDANLPRVKQWVAKDKQTFMRW